MKVDLAKLRADPRFAELDYADQLALTQRALYDNMRADPLSAALDDEGLVSVSSAAARTYAPVLRSKENVVLTDEDRARFAAGLQAGSEPNDATKYVLYLAEQNRAGNAEAIRRSGDWVRSQTLVRESWIGKIAALGADAYEAIQSGDRELQLGFDPEASERMRDYLVASMGQEAGSRVSSQASALGGLANFGENALLNGIFVGSLAAPGLLTKGLFGAARQAVATAAPGLAHAGAKFIASYGIEALGSAGIDVLRSLPEIVQAGQLSGSRAFWEKTAKTFGEGIAFDVLFNVASDVVRAGLKPVAKVFFGRRFDLAEPEQIRALQDAVTRAGNTEETTRLISKVVDGSLVESDIRNLDPDVQEALLSSAARVKNYSQLRYDRFDSDDFLVLQGKASGYDVEPVKSGYVFKRDGQVVGSSASRPDAFSWLGANVKETIGMDDLIAPYRGQEGARAVVSLRGKVDAGKLSDDTILGMTVATRDGLSDAKTSRLALQTLLQRSKPDIEESVLRGIKTTTVSEASFRTRVANLPKLLKDAPDRLVVPKTFSSDSTREAFLDYLTKFGRQFDPNFRNVGLEYSTKSTLTPQGLSAAASRLPGGRMLQEGETFRLSWEGPDGQVVSRVAQSPDEASRILGRAFVENGVLSESEIFHSVYRESGVALERETSEFGVSQVVGRGADGKVFVRGPDIESIFVQRPSLWPRLPEALGPDLYYLGGDKFELRRTVASGPYRELISVMDNFGASKVPASWKVIDQTAGGKVRMRAPASSRVTSSFAVEVDGLGFQTEFTTLKKAKEFMGSEFESFESVRRVAEIKGYELIAGPKQTILIRAVDGTAQGVASNLDEARRFLSTTPMSAAQKRLFTAIDPEIDDKIVHDVQERLEKMVETTDLKAPEKTLSSYQGSYGFDTVKNAIDARIAPSLSALERMAKRTGLPELTENPRKVAASIRAMGAANLKSERVIRAITSPNGKMISKEVNEVLGRILEAGPENWDTAAKGLGLELTAQHRAVLNATRSYYSRMSSIFGIDSWRYLTEYAPKIRTAIEQVKDSGDLTVTTKGQLLTRVFGAQWRSIPEVRFFAEHARLDNFLDATRNQRGLIEQMTFYSEQGYHELYLGSVQKKMSSWLREVDKSNLETSVKQRVFEYYYDVFGGGVNDPLARTVEDVSLALTSKMSEGMKAIGGAFPKPVREAFERAAERIVTPDLPGKASAMVTHATLGFRPFRGISNLFQYMNTYSVFGDDAVRAMTEVTDEQVEALFRKGIIQEKVFATSAEGVTARSRLLEAGLKPQQQSEYLTRAWTAEAAGRSFDAALVRLANGTIDADGFVRESRVNLLDPNGVNNVLTLLRSGQTDAAKTAFQADTVRILMFDYAKENYPLLFKGVVGRAFGKFGIFPAGQIDLYRRILESGPLADKVLRATRMIASSVLVYNAFRSIGVDYSGFLWNDAFSFSGGPMFQMGADLLHVADKGPEGQMARRDLSRSFLPGFDSDGNFTVPRLVVPGALEINALIKSANMANESPYRAMLTALGATTSKNWTGGGLNTW